MYKQKSSFECFPEALCRFHRLWAADLLNWKVGMGPPSSLLHYSFCPLLCPSLLFLSHCAHGSSQQNQLDGLSFSRSSFLLPREGLKEPVWEELNHSLHWRRDVISLTTHHTGLTDEFDIPQEENPTLAVASVFSCSIFLIETWLNTSQLALQFLGISRMHILCLFLGFFLFSISCTGSILVPGAAEVANSPPISLCEVGIPQWGAPSVPMLSTGMIWITQYQWPCSS